MENKNSFPDNFPFKLYKDSNSSITKPGMLSTYKGKAKRSLSATNILSVTSERAECSTIRFTTSSWRLFWREAFVQLKKSFAVTSELLLFPLGDPLTISNRICDPLRRPLNGIEEDKTGCHFNCHPFINRPNYFQILFVCIDFFLDQDTQERASLVAFLVVDLAGSYGEIGMDDRDHFVDCFLKNLCGEAKNER